MNLHEIETRDAPLPAGPFDLSATRRRRRDPTLSAENNP